MTTYYGVPLCDAALGASCGQTDRQKYRQIERQTDRQIMTTYNGVPLCDTALIAEVLLVESICGDMWRELCMYACMYVCMYVCM